MGTIAAAILHAQHAQVIDRLRAANAVSEGTAVQRSALGDVNDPAIEQMRKHGIVVRTTGGALYLSERGLDAYLAKQRKVLRIILAVSVVVILAATAAFAFRAFG